MKKVKNLIGKKVNNLMVVSMCENRDKQGKILWNCLCDCGKNIEVRTYNLTNIKTPIKSCGCVNNLNRRNANMALNQKYATYKRDAILRNLDFDLDKEKFYSLMKDNCFYCGSEPEEWSPYINNNGEIIEKFKDKVDLEYMKETLIKINGIDRFDNTKGYYDENVVTCCSMCNYMKKVYSFSDFKNQIFKIYNHLNHHHKV